MSAIVISESLGWTRVELFDQSDVPVASFYVELPSQRAAIEAMAVALGQVGWTVERR